MEPLNLLGKVTSQVAEYRRQIELLEGGQVCLGYPSDDGLEWIDLVPERIEELKRRVRLDEELLSKAAPNRPYLRRGS